MSQSGLDDSIPEHRAPASSGLGAARNWFLLTGACAIAGVVLSVYSAVQARQGFFASPWERGLNTLVFFTVQSNIIAGATSLWLAFRPNARSLTFRTARLTGVVCITVTGLVYHVALRGLAELDSVGQLGNQLVHTVVPLLTLGVWLHFGPRRLTSTSVTWLTVVFPLAWLVFTLVRGAVVGFYPYPFLDVSTLGYLKVSLNCVWVALLLLGLAAGASAIDSRLRPIPLRSED